MTLANIVLQKLSETNPVNGRHDLAFADEASGWTLYLTADRTDELSVLAWEMSLRRPEGSGDVASWAKVLEKKTGGTFEALKLLEVDAPRRQALVRSANPVLRQGKLFYYELILQGASSISVRRYQATNQGEAREQIAFALTHEALSRIVEDLCAA